MGIKLAYPQNRGYIRGLLVDRRVPPANNRGGRARGYLLWPVGKGVLRVGTELTPKTKITAAGALVSLDSLEPGARVRINFRRVTDGDEAISVEVLHNPKG